MSRVFERPEKLRRLLPKPSNAGIPSAFAEEALHSAFVFQLAAPYRSPYPPTINFQIPAMSPTTRGQMPSSSVIEPLLAAKPADYPALESSSTLKNKPGKQLASTIAPMSTPKSAPKRPTRSTKKTKFGLPEKGQKRISFTPKLEQHQDLPAITKILSQYEILEKIANNLSSADLVHLAATNKEHKKYITGSKPIHDRFKSSALCDGKGIKSRAHCFGHWNGDPSKATVKCKEGDCKPCCKCEAMVCQVCRYHMQYLEDFPCCEDDEAHYEFHEHNEAAEAWSEYVEAHVGLRPPVKSPEFSLEMLKALGISGEARERRFCLDCRPFPTWSALAFYVIEEENGEEDGIYPWCHCNAPCRFMHMLPWLCIPCFTIMETEAAGRRLEHDVYLIKKNPDTDSEFPSIREFVDTEYLCDCGKPALKDDIIKCRWCSGLIKIDDWDSLSIKAPQPRKKK